MLWCHSCWDPSLTMIWTRSKVMSGNMKHNFNVTKMTSLYAPMAQHVISHAKILPFPLTTWSIVFSVTFLILLILNLGNQCKLKNLERQQFSKSLQQLLAYHHNTITEIVWCFEIVCNILSAMGSVDHLLFGLAPMFWSLHNRNFIPLSPLWMARTINMKANSWPLKALVHIYMTPYIQL